MIIPSEPLFTKIYQTLVGDTDLLALLGATDVGVDPRIWWLNRPQGIGGYPVLTFHEVSSGLDTRFRGATIGSRTIMFSIFTDQASPELLHTIEDRVTQLLNWKQMSVAGILITYIFYKTDSMADVYDDASRTWSKRFRFLGVTQTVADATANT